MSEYCVVVAEGSRARFFTVEQAEIPELESGPNLVEHSSMANPEHQARGNAIYADLRSGRNRSAYGSGHGYDDHRNQHDAEMERRFAREIARKLDEMTRGNGTQRVVLCAEKQMLGYLRPNLNGAIPHGVAVHEVPKDLAKLSVRQLHERLAKDGYIPRRKARNGP
ncbi:MAG: host attachment protein [Ectothiorhodospiraceae bacterium]|nr:host attachment protein [Ectothiorhodospiraceae bacterium]